MTLRPDIEGLRAVAIVVVLIAHAGLGFGVGGFVGVDVFFVISGFLITSLLVREVERRGTVSLLGFYARRARRILPAAAVVIVSSASFYSTVQNGEKLTGERNDEILEGSYESTLERLRETGAEVVVLLDLPHAPFDVSECVSGELDSLSRCAFHKREAKNTDPFDVAAVSGVPGVHTIDVTKVICPDDVCRPVIGDALVYRGSNHLTATFAKSLERFVRAELPTLR